MEILVKKDTQNPSGKIPLLNLIKEFKKVLKDDFKVIIELKKEIEDLRTQYNSLKDEFNTIQKIMNKKYIDLTSASSIEKNEKIPNGVIYFNSRKKELRVKMNNTWKTIVLK